MSTAVLYDAGVLIAADKKDRRFTQIHDFVCARTRPLLPITVYAQALRNPATQVVLQRAVDTCDLAPLTKQDVREMAPLLATTGASDIVDGHVVAMALRLDAVIYSSDPDDLRELATAAGRTLRIIPV